LSILVSTPGKIILIGEYAVLEGASSLVMAINRFARIKIDKNETKFLLSAPNLDIDSLEYTVDKNKIIQFINQPHSQLFKKISLVKSILEYVFSKIETGLNPFHLSIDTSDFYSLEKKQKFGLGSSAAICVAIIKAVTAILNLNKIDQDELFRYSINAHQYAQGKEGSGIDIAASVYQGLLQYKMPDKKNNEFHIPEKIEFPDNLYVIPVYTGFAVPTVNYIKKINQFKKENNTVYNQIINELKTVSSQACNNLRSGNLDKFLNNIDKYYLKMEQLGESANINIISPVHKQIAQLVRDCGGFYKPSGAGGGDIGIALTTDQEIKGKITELIRLHGYEILNLKIIKN